jgi:predicted PhzF superfamily epimerase YddE/YHI9
VDLCGHATLASAHILWQTGTVKPESELHFFTRSGLLTARNQGDWIELNFPVTPVSAAVPPAGLAQMLGADPLFVGKSVFDHFVEISSEQLVRDLVPDLARIKTIGMRGLIVTSRATTAGYDFVSRFFGPQVGVDEDPVTGSAHCALAQYWSEKLGKTAMTACQVSARSGDLRVFLDGERVRIQGQAVTVIRGVLEG